MPTVSAKVRCWDRWNMLEFVATSPLILICSVFKFKVSLLKFVVATVSFPAATVAIL